MYLRINKEDNTFGFVVEGIHDIVETDIAITDEEHKEFFELQSAGKQFRLKEEPSEGDGLFCYVEEFVPEIVPVVQEPGVEEYLLDMDYRLSLLELGV